MPGERPQQDVTRLDTSFMESVAVSKLGHLSARPDGTRINKSAPTGLQSLRIETMREGHIYVPERYRGDRALPLVLMFHGAGGNSRLGLAPLLKLADPFGLILAAPASHAFTWDVIIEDYGVDLTRVDRFLSHVFAHYAIDPSRIAIGGFSDGASYALSLGVMNGDLFSHILAFSPGFMISTVQRGNPRVFISHGTDDSVLPIDKCSRRIVPKLLDAGYEVSYREFEGGHNVPSDIAREAVHWLAGRAGLH
ncbi:phospholipase/carboxylesterase [Methylocaldum marinum]|uniref:Phospholipase/carboxylesterase n=1 Tax=Methylocaldum marinum TaxID=1432792 RepID=A0A250L2F5_9GAMM|nr:phospholipase/carboxylesterase [Methylocaldum marinum]